MNELFDRPGPMLDKSREAVKSERLKARQERRYDSIRQFLRSILADAQQQGAVRADVDVDAAAELMLALNEGIVLLSVAGLRQVDLDTLKAAYVSLLNGGLSSPHAPLFSRHAANPTGGL